ncbi:hypothetical protein JH06_0797 [Blastocystis sp. subtype 4]|uniref:hypothetical protein n=1 Tax=Blastocystis sp. subtype 4 TaxID=944170 RepID=UPI0007117D2D|nr:hypothetical protein JH06_0797 [Blastocystis sp. subtype 4]KNB46470.1 hypothetical protein JH06_0797 [Blastocystis sp. subtype 4]|eukprot:XP_014529900.1 hypothetical protein JH06_0797 [Blastocystis sp. subtype 4]
MKRLKVGEKDKENDRHIYFSELETEYKRQIEYHKEEEKKAKESLRQMEIDFIKQKQTLESELDQERALSSELRLQVLVLRGELESLNNDIESSIISSSNRSVLSERPSISRIDDESDVWKKKYEQAVRDLQLYKQQVEETISKGGFNCTSWRVLHMQENPIAEATTKKIDILKQQLEETQQALRKLSQSPGAASPILSETPSSVSLLGCEASMKEEIDTLKKRIERMREVFATQTNRFRDAVYQLTGWNVDLSLHDNRLRLKSRYAPSREDTIELMW